MKLTEDQIDKINFSIKNIFYYVEYPDSAQEYFWKDRNGDFNFMEDMELDHLKASVALIARDIKNFKSSHEKDKNYNVYKKYLLIPAEQKQLELKEIFKQKAII